MTERKSGNGTAKPECVYVVPECAPPAAGAGARGGVCSERRRDARRRGKMVWQASTASSTERRSRPGLTGQPAARRLKRQAVPLVMYPVFPRENPVNLRAIDGKFKGEFKTCPLGIIQPRYGSGMRPAAMSTSLRAKPKRSPGIR